MLAACDRRECQGRKLQRRVNLIPREELVKQRRRALHGDSVLFDINAIGLTASRANNQPVKEGRAELTKPFSLNVGE
jgi:hypothetical protein